MARSRSTDDAAGKPPCSQNSLAGQGSFTFPAPLSGKTTEENWSEIWREKGKSTRRQVDIEHNIEAESEIHETEVDDQNNIETQNEGNGESVTVPGRAQHIDVENQGEQVIVQGTVHDSVVEEDPANGDLAARVKFGSKIGSLAASISVAGIIPMIFNNSVYHGKNLYDKLLLGASLLFMLISFVFGVVLLQGRPFFHLQIFPMNNPKSTGRIKFVTGAVDQ